MGAGGMEGVEGDRGCRAGRGWMGVWWLGGRGRGGEIHPSATSSSTAPPLHRHCFKKKKKCMGLF